MNDLKSLAQCFHERLLASSLRPGPLPIEPTSAVATLASALAVDALEIIQSYARMEISTERLSELLGVNIAEVMFLWPVVRDTSRE